MASNHSKPLEGNGKDVCNLSHRDIPAVHELFKSFVEHESEYSNIGEWAGEMKRDMIKQQDELPEDIAEYLAESCEEKAQKKRNKANDLLDDAGELEEEAEKLRKIASADFSIGEDDNPYTREKFVEQLVEDAEAGQTVLVMECKGAEYIAQQEGEEFYEFSESVRDEVREESGSDDVFVNEAGLDALDLL